MNQDQRTTVRAYANQRPDEIEREIAGTRSELDHTLDALQERLSAGSLMNQAKGYLRGSTSGGRDFMTHLTESIKRNPVPAAMIGLGVAWMMMSGARARGTADYEMNRQLPMRASDADVAGFGDTTDQAARRDIIEREGLTPEDREMRNIRPGSPTTPGL